MNDLDERTLLLRAQRGDVHSFGELVRRYQTTVFSVCLRLLGDRGAAEDAAQETFVRAFQRLHTFDSSRPFGPWIRRVAANFCFNLLQSRRNIEQELSEETASTLPAQHDGMEDNPLDVVLRSEEAARVRAAILALPSHFRMVVELRHFQDLNYDEIASELQTSLSSVKTHLFRARRMLADLLSSEGSNDAGTTH